MIFCVALVCTAVFNSCTKDEDSSNSIVKDADGNVYNTITIGTQIWMVENLKTTKYRNGDAIPDHSGDSEGMYFNYDNAANANKYGRLYNWYAVNDSRKLAPQGWHVPTSDEWTTLSTYISTHQGTSGSEAKALAATSSWLPSTDVNVIGNDLMKNNSSGFTALPGGYRIPASFYCIGSKGFWWSSTEFSSGGAYIRFLTSGDKEMCGADFNWEEKEYGLSVRCVKD